MSSRVYDHRSLVGGPSGIGSSSAAASGPSTLSTPASAAAAAAQAAMSQSSSGTPGGSGSGPSGSNAVGGGPPPPSAQSQSQQQQQQAPPPIQMQPGATAASLARLNDLLEFVRAEFDQVVTESSLLKMQREEYEAIIGHHAAELNAMRAMLYDLQSKHLEDKRQMQEELNRLQDELVKARRQIDGTSASSSVANNNPARPSSSNSHHARPTLPPILGNRPASASSSSNAAGPGAGGPPASLHPLEPSNSNNGREDHVHPNKRAKMGEEDIKPIQSSKSKPRSSANKSSPHPASPAHRPRSAQAVSPRSTAPRAATPDTLAHRNDQVSPKSTVPNGGGLARIETTLPDRHIPTPETFDPETVARDLKKEGSDWMTIFNPNVKRVLDVGLVHTLLHDSVVCCVKFSPDGRTLATGCNKNTTLYDTKTGARTSILADESVEDDTDNYIRSVSFSPDGKLLATGSEDKIIRIWNISQKSILKTLTGHTSEIYSLAFSPDGKRLVSGSGDRTARIWDLDAGTCLHTLAIEETKQSAEPGEAGVTSVVLSPDGTLLAAGSLDMVIRIWDARSGRLIERLRGHKDSVYSVAFSPDGKFLVSASLDKTLKMWDTLSLRHAIDRAGPAAYKEGDHKVACMTTLQGHKDFVLSVAISPDGQWIVSGSKDRGVQFWDPATAKAHFMLQGHKNSVISVAVSDAGGLVATGSGDWSARIWSYERVA